MEKELSLPFPSTGARQGRRPILRDEKVSRCPGSFADARYRALLVAKTRWIILGLVSGYALVAGVLFTISPHGFFLSPAQITVIICALLAVLLYNGLYYFGLAQVQRLPGGESLPIILDLFLVTLLIYFSGGAASWFWPVYLIVTLEAAVLLENPRDVWGVGLLGGVFYGALLTGEYTGIFPVVNMPFVEGVVSGDVLHFSLAWSWVSLLNATVAVVGIYLMGVIRRENQALRDSEERLSGFLDAANDLIFSVDDGGHLVYANRSWIQATGHDPERGEPLQVMSIMHPDSRFSTYRDILKVIAGEHVGSVETSFVGRDGRQVEVEGTLTRLALKSGDKAQVWVICRDTTARKRAEAQLNHLAHHDQLTGLYNRRCFLERLEHSLALTRRAKKFLAVLFLDLDRFKIINDTLGHTFGDRLLAEMAMRLRQCVRQTDTVARMGGDEFIACLSSLESAEDAERIASKILKSLSQPVWIEGRELFITTSIGISYFPMDGDEPFTLVKRADMAMYSAKAQGRNNWQNYQLHMDRDADRRLLPESGIRRALESDQFCLHYQPKVDVVTGRITALEALVRWDHPDLGLLSAGEFIPLAEETGVIFQLGEWVLRQACRQNKAWQEQGLPFVRVAVNISGYQLQQRSLIDQIEAVLAETRLAASCLEIEITETVIMQNPDFAVSVLKDLRELGIHLSIDDFGTGYSSLAHLKRFCVNTLKIDKSFMRDIESSDTDAAIATAIIAMGNSLKLQVIAEGVETEGQLAFLRKNSCQEMQGYLFSRPIPAHQVPGFLKKAALRACA